MVIESKVKKTSEEIRNAILNSLKDGPRTITEISESVNSNWITVEDYLKRLKEDKKVIEIVSSPKMKVYRRMDDLAFYGLPFSKEIRERTFALLCLIAKMWRKQTEQKNPSRTVLQKVAVEFIEESKGEIDLPILNFHYGQTLALRYDEKFENECRNFKLTNNQKILLEKLINKYKRWSAGKSQEEQYKKEGMEFYKTKEELLDAFSLDNNEDIIKKVLELSVYYPSELTETYELFDKFEYCSINALNIINEEERKKYLKKLKEIFSLIWDVITTNSFFHEAEKYIEEERKELFNYIKLNTLNSKISNVSPIVDDLKSEIDSIPLKEINLDSSEKSKELLSKLLNGL